MSISFWDWKSPKIGWAGNYFFLSFSCFFFLKEIMINKSHSFLKLRNSVDSNECSKIAEYMHSAVFNSLHTCISFQEKTHDSYYRNLIFMNGNVQCNFVFIYFIYFILNLCSAVDVLITVISLYTSTFKLIVFWKAIAH